MAKTFKELADMVEAHFDLGVYGTRNDFYLEPEDIKKIIQALKHAAARESEKGVLGSLDGKPTGGSGG